MDVVMQSQAAFVETVLSVDGVVSYSKADWEAFFSNLPSGSALMKSLQDNLVAKGLNSFENALKGAHQARAALGRLEDHMRGKTMPKFLLEELKVLRYKP